MSEQVSMTAMCSAIASYLTTDTESKNHGGYKVYKEPEKIEIWLDTYVPNCTVYVWIDGEKKLAMLYNGAHHRMQEYHGGEWEKYIKSLYPKAAEARQVALAAQQERERQQAAARNARLDDAATFS